MFTAPNVAHTFCSRVYVEVPAKTTGESFLVQGKREGDCAAGNCFLTYLEKGAIFYQECSHSAGSREGEKKSSWERLAEIVGDKECNRKMEEMARKGGEKEWWKKEKKKKSLASSDVDGLVIFRGVDSKMEDVLQEM